MYTFLANLGWGAVGWSSSRYCCCCRGWRGGCSCVLPRPPLFIVAPSHFRNKANLDLLQPHSVSVTHYSGVALLLRSHFVSCNINPESRRGLHLQANQTILGLDTGWICMLLQQMRRFRHHMLKKFYGVEWEFSQRRPPVPLLWPDPINRRGRGEL